MKSTPAHLGGRTSGRARWIARRNAVFADPRFQHWAAKLPIIRRIARIRARGAFDILAGFTYSQVLRAFVDSNLFEVLSEGPVGHGDVAKAIDLSDHAALTLLRAGRALKLADEAGEDEWMLGEQGAILAANPGAQAMIRHQSLLYRDLADPLALLRRDRKEPTDLSRYWSYAGALHGAGQAGEDTGEYSQLMAASQHFVADQVLTSFRFPKRAKLLDVGGGHGAFLERIGTAYPDLELGLFDLPEVAEAGGERLREALGSHRVSVHPGDFFRAAIPEGYDIVSLVRILHDHDDEPAAELLANIRRSLAPGARLLIAEPMARVAGAEAMGEAFFGMYLWAMGSGRPRSPDEIASMAKAAGFAGTRAIPTLQPINASLVVATA
ncbi:MAG: methyltransferase [Erythrobacter sp.]|uniref:methyltransferase n=1 Tax=Erythrobacter sp. TaxID=1042 RepID=UPI003C78CA11